MSLFGKEKRKLWRIRIKNFWFDFSHNKIGLLGVSILLVFIFGGIFADVIMPYSPYGEWNLADSMAMPEWITVFPSCQGLPRTMITPLNWSAGEIRVEDPDLLSVQWNETGSQTTITYSGDGSKTQLVHARMSVQYFYGYRPCETIIAKFYWMGQPKTINVTKIVYGREITTTESTVEFSIELIFIDPNGTEWSLWDSYRKERENVVPYTVPLRTEPTLVRGKLARFGSGMRDLEERLGWAVEDHRKMVASLFSEEGNYTLLLDVAFRPTETGIELKNATCEIGLHLGMRYDDQFGIFETLGLVHGIMGCDQSGRDIFSQIVGGIRISLAIGLSAAIVSTAMGILVGVLAGYTGGITDELLMRMVDILLCLPVLPLLLALVGLFGSNVFYIVLLIAIFGWQGLSRTIRSQVLYLREMPFIECARAAGGNKSYIMMRHLVPNVLPIALAAMVLGVPGAILTEAGLSFLGFGDPTAPTWGKMLQSAWHYGAFDRLAWWWVIPPGLAITLICVAFVFIGHALDEIVNPRLRRRR